MTLEKVTMTPEEIIAHYMKKDQRILHIGGDPALEQLAESYDYTRIEVEDLDLENIPSKPYDYAILGSALELVDDPVAVIKAVKNLARIVVIYEYKYDQYKAIDETWKQPWKSIGLEYTLTREFDLINNRFLGYATIHTCEMPFNGQLVDEEVPDAIR